MCFIGGCGTVTGSCTLLRYTHGAYEMNILVDCGQFQNEPPTKGSINFLMRNASKITMLLLTHAHFDHIGLLPMLIENGFNAKIFCTSATKDLLFVMLKDQMSKENYSVERINKIFSVIRTNIDAFDEDKGFQFGNKTTGWIWKSPRLHLIATRSAHVLGSCSYLVRWYCDKLPETGKSSDYTADKWRFIAFSGDLGSVNTEEDNSLLQKDVQVPFYGKENCFIVMESTYGEHCREPIEDIVETRCKKLVQIIRETFTNNGHVLIPAFALNRAQEILLDLKYINHKDMLDIDGVVKFDSPLINNVNKVYSDHFFTSKMNKDNEIKYLYLPKMFMKKFGFDPEHFTLENEKKARQIFCDALYPKQTEGSDESLNGKIIVTASGMCEQGRVLKYLKETLTDKNSCIVLTGYQAEGTNGYYLKNLDSYSQDEKYNIMLSLGDDETIRLEEVVCKIYDLGMFYSGHADQTVLSEYPHGFKAKMQNVFKTKVFLTHGTNPARSALKDRIEELNTDKRCANRQNEYTPHQIKVILPKALKWYTLSDSASTLSQEQIQEDVENLIAEIPEAERMPNTEKLLASIDPILQNMSEEALLLLQERIVKRLNEQ